MAQILFIPAGSAGPPAGGPDHFAPKYVVGNVPAGDDPAPYNTGGFVYVPDPGDGSGIALALTQFAGPGDVWIRPGFYTLAPAAGTLVVPVGVTVRGAGLGLVTVIGGLLSQTVWDLANNTSLSDMLVISGGNPAGVQLSAVICRGTYGELRNVEVRFTPNVAGGIRNGIEFPGPITQITNWNLDHVRVNALATTGAANPSRCILFGNVLVNFRDVTCLGGDIGVDGTGGAFIGLGLWCNNWRLVGLRTLGGATFIIQQGQISTNVGGGIALQMINGGDHTFRSVSLDFQGGAVGAAAVVIQGGGGGNGTTFDTCRVLGNWDRGIEGTAATIVNIRSCRMGARRSCIRAINCRLWFISDCDLTTTIPTAPTVHLQGGGEHAFSECRVDHFGVSGATAAVLVENCPSVRVVNNEVLSSDVGGIRLTGSLDAIVEANRVLSRIAGATSAVRVDAGADNALVSGNKIDFRPSASLLAPVQVETAYCVVSGNVIQRTVGAAAVGVALAATSSQVVCVGNTVRGAPGGAVQDLGAGNEVAHNIGGP